VESGGWRVESGESQEVTSFIEAVEAARVTGRQALLALLRSTPAS
jgi:hypothetical protein